MIMRSLYPSPFPFLPIFLRLFLCSIIFHLGSATNLVHETCNKCSKSNPNLSYEFCKTSLESSEEGRHCSDLHKLGLISIKLTKSNVSSTKHFIKQFLRNINYEKELLQDNNKKKIDPFVKACLSDCLDLYTDAFFTIKEAIKDYRANQYDDANIGLSSVMDAATTCEDGFSDKMKLQTHHHNHVVSPLTKRNNDTFKLTAISLFIINTLSN